MKIVEALRPRIIWGKTRAESRWYDRSLLRSRMCDLNDLDDMMMDGNG